MPEMAPVVEWITGGASTAALGAMLGLVRSRLARARDLVTLTRHELAFEDNPSGLLSTGPSTSAASSTRLELAIANLSREPLENLKFEVVDVAPPPWIRLRVGNQTWLEPPRYERTPTGWSLRLPPLRGMREFVIELPVPRAVTSGWVRVTFDFTPSVLLGGRTASFERTSKVPATTTEGSIGADREIDRRLEGEHWPTFGLAVAAGAFAYAATAHLAVGAGLPFGPVWQDVIVATLILLVATVLWLLGRPYRVGRPQSYLRAWLFRPPT
jgi:hypothetical protein